MKLKEPESMKDLVYFTNRDNKRIKARAWVFKKECPECGKALMGKPINEKTGKVKRRAKKYVCPECGYEEPKKEHEESLKLSIEYTCPECGHEGQVQIPFKRRTYYGVKAFVFHCEKCDHKLALTKKMKAPKKKKKK